MINTKTSGVSLLIVLLGISSLTVNSFNSFLNLPTTINQEKGGYETRVGTHFKYIEALKQITQEESLVIHPPQGDQWPAIGNQPILRFFLFPRILVSGALLTDQKVARDLGKAYFVEIDPGVETTHWPKIDYNYKTVIFDTKTELEYSNLNLLTGNNSIKVFEVNF